MAKKYDAQKKYNETNTILKSVRLNIKLDGDILDYLEGKKFQTTVKKALRVLIAQEKEKENGI